MAEEDVLEALGDDHGGLLALDFGLCYMLLIQGVVFWKSVTKVECERRVQPVRHLVEDLGYPADGLASTDARGTLGRGERGYYTFSCSIGGQPYG